MTTSSVGTGISDGFPGGGSRLVPGDQGESMNEDVSFLTDEGVEEAAALREAARVIEGSSAAQLDALRRLLAPSGKARLGPNPLAGAEVALPVGLACSKKTRSEILEILARVEQVLLEAETFRNVATGSVVGVRGGEFVASVTPGLSEIFSSLSFSPVEDTAKSHLWASVESEGIACLLPGRIRDKSLAAREMWPHSRRKELAWLIVALGAIRFVAGPSQGCLSIQCDTSRPVAIHLLTAGGQRSKRSAQPRASLVLGSDVYVTLRLCREGGQVLAEYGLIQDSSNEGVCLSRGFSPNSRVLGHYTKTVTQCVEDRAVRLGSYVRDEEDVALSYAGERPLMPEYDLSGSDASVSTYRHLMDVDWRVAGRLALLDTLAGEGRFLQTLLRGLTVSGEGMEALSDHYENLPSEAWAYARAPQSWFPAELSGKEGRGSAEVGRKGKSVPTEHDLQASFRSSSPSNAASRELTLGASGSRVRVLEARLRALEAQNAELMRASQTPSRVEGGIIPGLTFGGASVINARSRQQGTRAFADRSRLMAAGPLGTSTSVSFAPNVSSAVRSATIAAQGEAVSASSSENGDGAQALGGHGIQSLGGGIPDAFRRYVDRRIEDVQSHSVQDALCRVLGVNRKYLDPRITRELECAGGCPPAIFEEETLAELVRGSQDVKAHLAYKQPLHSLGCAVAQWVAPESHFGSEARWELELVLVVLRFKGLTSGSPGRSLYPRRLFEGKIHSKDLTDGDLALMVNQQPLAEARSLGLAQKQKTKLDNSVELGKVIHATGVILLRAAVCLPKDRWLLLVARSCIAYGKLLRAAAPAPKAEFDDLVDYWEAYVRGTRQILLGLMGGQTRMLLCGVSHHDHDSLLHPVYWMECPTRREIRAWKSKSDQQNAIDAVSKMAAANGKSSAPASQKTPKKVKKTVVNPEDKPRYHRSDKGEQVEQLVDTSTDELRNNAKPGATVCSMAQYGLCTLGDACPRMVKNKAAHNVLPAATLEKALGRKFTAVERRLHSTAQKPH